MYGCAVCCAERVKAAIASRQNTFESLLDSIHPWHCLVCCGDSNTGLAVLVHNLLQQICEGEVYAPRIALPDYVTRNLESVGPNYDDVEPPQGIPVDGILVVRDLQN